MCYLGIRMEPLYRLLQSIKSDSSDLFELAAEAEAEALGLRQAPASGGVPP
jgi:hypothetical protein